MQIDRTLIGQSVRNAAKPEWGVGKVTAVQATQSAGQPAHRVTVVFPVVGTKAMLVPPAQLAAPSDEPTRAKGWLDELAGVTLDDRLTKVPKKYEQVLGTPAQRLRAVLDLYRYSDDPASLLRWARNQTGVGDPLTHWSRDELATAFARFAGERDSLLRARAAQLRLKEGDDAVKAEIDMLEEPVERTRVREALGKII